MIVVNVIMIIMIIMVILTSHWFESLSPPGESSDCRHHLHHHDHHHHRHDHHDYYHHHDHYHHRDHHHHGDTHQLLVRISLASRWIFWSLSGQLLHPGWLLLSMSLSAAIRVAKCQIYYRLAPHTAVQTWRPPRFQLNNLLPLFPATLSRPLGINVMKNITILSWLSSSPDPLIPNNQHELSVSSSLSSSSSRPPFSPVRSWERWGAWGFELKEFWQVEDYGVEDHWYHEVSRWKFLSVKLIIHQNRPTFLWTVPSDQTFCLKLQFSWWKIMCLDSDQLVM